MAVAPARSSATARSRVGMAVADALWRGANMAIAVGPGCRRLGAIVHHSSPPERSSGSTDNSPGRTFTCKWHGAFHGALNNSAGGLPSVLDFSSHLDRREPRRQVGDVRIAEPLRYHAHHLVDALTASVGFELFGYVHLRLASNVGHVG
jgi:hypothetical protein